MWSYLSRCSYLDREYERLVPLPTTTPKNSSTVVTQMVLFTMLTYPPCLGHKRKMIQYFSTRRHVSQKEGTHVTKPNEWLSFNLGCQLYFCSRCDILRHQTEPQTLTPHRNDELQNAGNHTPNDASLNPQTRLELPYPVLM